MLWICVGVVTRPEDLDFLMLFFLLDLFFPMILGKFCHGDYLNLFPDMKF